MTQTINSFTNTRVALMSGLKRKWIPVQTGMKMWMVMLAILIGLTSATFQSADAQTTVTAVVPAKNALNISPTTTVQVTFSAAMLTTSFNDTTSFIVSGVTSGRHRGTFSFSGGNTVATFTPTVAFKKGEAVVVDLTSNLKNASNASLTPFVYTFTVGVNSSAGTFATKVDIATDGGNGVNTVLANDIDGDGDDDIITLNQNANAVSVLKSNGNGTFATKVDYGTGPYPLFMCANDIDGDGDADLMVTNGDGWNISVLKNNGNGTFAAKVDYNTGANPKSLYAYDLDGDGDADMMVVNHDNNNVSILKNNGNGTFAAKVDYAAGTNPIGVCASDVDGDGDADIITTNSNSDNVSVLKNNGDGTFASKTDYTVGDSPRSVFAGDIDGDGDADILVGNLFASTVSVLKNNGNGTFQTTVDYATDAAPRTVLYASDIDGDGDADIITANQNSNNVSVLKNNGNGTFAAKIDYTTGTVPVFAYVCDMNGDGIGDILTANLIGNTVSILMGNAPPLTVTTVVPAKNALNVLHTATVQVTFSAAMLTSSFNDTTSFIVSGVTRGRHRGTFSFSGGNTVATFTPTIAFKKGEAVVVDLSSNLKNASNVALTPFVYTFTVSASVSPGTFGAKVDYTAGSYPYSVFVSDVDGDGDGDLATANSDASTVSILKNNGDGTFAAKVDYTTGTYPYSVFISDVDGDGDGDLAVSNIFDATVSVFKNNGDGTFAEKVDYLTGYYPYSVFISDVDGDGDGDLAVSSEYYHVVSILKNNGDGTFTEKVDYWTGYYPYSIFISDVDGDGDGDIAAANYGSNSVSILKNNGDGTFAAKVDYATGTNPQSVFISDVDGDSDGDLAVANLGSTTVSILKNNGNGTFATKVDYTTGSSPVSVFINDVDGDGDGDLAVANNGSANVSILKNNGNGTYAAKTDYATGTDPRSVFVSDVNGDGIGDIAVANYSSSSVSILKGNANSFTITATAGANGSITPSGAVIVNNGANQTFTISANSGYHIDSVIVDGVKVDSVMSYTFNNVTSNHTIRAVFAINTYTLTVNAVNGTVAKNPDQANYNHGTNVQLTAAPTIGYHFVEWSGNLTGTENPDTITMDANKTVTANFAINTYTLTINATNGSVSKSPDNATYEHGTEVELTANPAIGYHFVEWSGDLTGTENPDTLTMDDDKEITAHFAINTYTLTINATNGTVSKSPDNATYEHGTEVELTAIPNDGYHFVEWSGDLNSTENPDTISMNSNKTVTANFAINTYTLSVTAENGSVTNTPDEESYEHGTEVILSATPETGYHFVEWSGDLISIENPDTLTMDDDKEVTANFAINVYALTVNTENGTVTRVPEQATYEHGTEVVLTATPSIGYHFVEWFDGEINSTDNPLTVTMTDEMTVIATFAINTYTITVNAGDNGTVTPATTIVEYDASQSFTYAPSTGYHIDSVLVDDVLVDSTTSYTFDDVTEDHTLAVTFAINTYVITVTAGEGGSISPSSNVTLNYGSSQAFAITALTNYEIDSVLVDDVKVDSSSSYTFDNVIANHSLLVKFRDVQKFRTFKESVTDFTAKTVKLAYKKEKLVAPPNMMTALENVFAKQVPKAGRTFLGVSQGTNKDSAKAYAWIDIKKAADLAKGFKAAHTGQSYPLDYLRDAVKGTKKKLSKALKFESKYDNPAMAQGILLKLNILASDSGVTPKGFGALVLDTTITLAGREMKGQTLTQVASFYDSVMTYWYRFGIDSLTDYQQLGNFATIVLKRINDGFYSAIDTASATRNYTTDSVAIAAKKVYAVTLTGAVAPPTVRVVKRSANTRTVALNSYQQLRNAAPSSFALMQNYPNPFNPTTAISFHLSAVSNVTLKIYNVLGQEVATLLKNEAMGAGTHEIQFDASALTSGVYVYKLTIDSEGQNFSSSKKLMLLK